MQIDIIWLIREIILGIILLLVPLAAIVWIESAGGKIAGALGALIISGGILAWNSFPFNMSYHYYRPVSGTVSSINSRQISSGHASETKYVITFKGSNLPYGCTDTRCAAVKVGDKLQLKCKRVWQYASVPGYDCNYDSVGV